MIKDKINLSRENDTDAIQHKSWDDVEIKEMFREQNTVTDML